jgi:hypothetical protein
MSLKVVDAINTNYLQLYAASAPNYLGGGISLSLQASFPPGTSTYQPLTGTFVMPIGYPYLILILNTSGSGIETVYWNAYSLSGMGSSVTSLIAPTNANDATTKNYVDTQDALRVPYTGATSTVNLGSQDIQTSYAPTVANDLTNKNYVDTQDALRVPYTGATSNVNLGAYSLIGSTARFTAITSATPSLALGVDGSGNLNTFAVPTSYINLIPLNNTWTGTNTFNNNITLGDGYSAILAEVGYLGQNYITSATPTTVGITAAAPTPTGTITFSTPTYTLTPSGASTFASFWSSATFTGSARCFFNFTNMSLANAPSGATFAVYQANTANTAYVPISSVFSIPQSATVFSGYFTPNSNASYLGQIFFILSNVKFNPFSWTAFTYGYGAWTVQGNETVNGTIQISNGVAPPATGITGGIGDRIILYPGGSGGYPYSIGINSSTLWYSSPAGCQHKWYVGGTDNMTLNSGGTLVLNQPSGGNHLQLINNSANAMYMNFNSNGGAGVAYIGMDSSAGTGLFGSGIPYSFDIGTSTATPICFFTNNVTTPRMQITATGNVGIGISPSYTLDINGNFRAGVSTGGNVSIQGVVGSPYCGYTEYKNGSTRQGYIGYGTNIGGELCLDMRAENGWGMDFVTTSHNIYFSTDGGSTQKLQIGTVGVKITSASADYTNSLVVNTAWPSIVLDGSGTTGRTWSILNGASGAGIGQGSFGIYDITSGAYRFAINSVGQTIIGYLGMTTNVPYANTYFYNSAGTYTGTSSTFGAYRYITFDSGRIYGAMSVATFQNGTITPLYNGMYCITFMVGGTSGAVLEIFISRNLHNNNDFNSGTPMADGLLACGGVVANETTITWTGYLATTDVVCCGCYTSGSAWTPYVYRSGITMALIQRMS